MTPLNPASFDCFTNPRKISDCVPHLFPLPQSQFLFDTPVCNSPIIKITNSVQKGPLGPSIYLNNFVIYNPILLVTYTSCIYLRLPFINSLIKTKDSVKEYFCTIKMIPDGIKICILKLKHIVSVINF